LFSVQRGRKIAVAGGDELTFKAKSIVAVMAAPIFRLIPIFFALLMKLVYLILSIYRLLIAVLRIIQNFHRLTGTFAANFPVDMQIVENG
jgi:hypothetical protein